MNEASTLARLQRFLSLLTVGLFLGTIVELLLIGHADSPIQLLPYALCGLGLVALLAARLRPGRRTGLALRATLIVIALGSLVGVAEHFLGNLEFARETQPNAEPARLLLAGLRGRDPLLAPGTLAVAGALAVAATYRQGEPAAVEPADRGEAVRSPHRLAQPFGGTRTR